MDVKDKNNIAELKGYLEKIDEVVQAKKKDRKKIINHLVDMANSYYEETKRLTAEVESLKNQLNTVLNMKPDLEKWTEELKNKMTNELKINIDENYKVINERMSNIAGAILKNRSEIEKIPEGLQEIKSKLEPIENASESMRKAQELFNTKKQECERLDSDLKSRESKLNEREENISNREQQLEIDKNEIEDYNRDNYNAIQNHERVTTENSKYRRKIDEHEKTIGDLKQQLESMSKEKQDLVNQVNELKHQQQTDNNTNILPMDE